MHRTVRTTSPASYGARQMEQLDREEEFDPAAALVAPVPGPVPEPLDDEDDGALVVVADDCAEMYEAVIVFTGKRLISS